METKIVIKLGTNPDNIKDCETSKDCTIESYLESALELQEKIDKDEFIGKDKPVWCPMCQSKGIPIAYHSKSNDTFS